MRVPSLGSFLQGCRTMSWTQKGIRIWRTTHRLPSSSFLGFPYKKSKHKPENGTTMEPRDGYPFRVQGLGSVWGFGDWCGAEGLLTSPESPIPLN